MKQNIHCLYTLLSSSGTPLSHQYYCECDDSNNTGKCHDKLNNMFDYRGKLTRNGRRYHDYARCRCCSRYLRLRTIIHSLYTTLLLFGSEQSDTGSNAALIMCTWSRESSRFDLIVERSGRASDSQLREPRSYAAVSKLEHIL